MLSPDRPNSGGVDSKYFIEPLKAKKSFSELKKTFPKATDYFNVKLYFSNAYLNFVEQIYYFPQQKIKRTYAWCQVSKRFVFPLSPLTNICSSFKDEKIYEYIFMNMFQTLLIVLALKFSHLNVHYF